MVADNKSGKLVPGSSSGSQTGVSRICHRFLGKNSQQTPPVGQNVSLESGANVIISENEDNEDINLEDICEVVLSLKCKQCEFLCNDKSTLAVHVRQNHSKSSSKKSHQTSVRFGNGVSDERKPQGTQPSFQTEPTSIVVTEHPGKFYKNDHVSSNAKCNNSKHKQRANSNDSTENSVASPGTHRGSGTVLSLEVVSDESVEDVFLCAECDIVFSSRDMCCLHMHKVHGLKQFSTDFIQEEIIAKPNQDPSGSRSRKTKLPRQFTSEAGTIVPKKYRVTKDVFHTCSKCPIKFESVEVMMFHEQCHLNINETDKIQCGTSFQRGDDEKCNLSGLLHDSRSVKGFLCPVCESKGTGSQLFPKWGICSWHLWKEHRIDCELYTCSVCKQFKSHLIARVKDHEQLHSGKSIYKCKTCSKTFKQMKQLRCHEKYHKDNLTKLPPPSDSRWYTPKECPICKRILSDSKCLKKHISAVHNKLKPYVCNICGHTSARKAELQLHVRQHTGEKPYKCSMCQFQTGDHNSLRKHKLRHSDERPYACPYCDYRCIQSCAFKKHIIACHPGQEVVFVCQLCSHASVNEPLFIAHQKDHAEGRITVATESSSSDDMQIPMSTNSKAKENGTSAKFWSGDEDSIDIVDNGGVTIPASPQCSNASDFRRKDPESATGKDSPPITNAALPSSFSTHGIVGVVPAVRKAEQTHRVSFVEPSPAFIVLKAEPNGGKQVTLLESQKDKLVALNSSQSSTAQIFCVTASLQALSSSASPRYSSSTADGSSQHQEIRGNDDTESSSEVITNPHQLIENIQLTPLDLTDIIACNEQSNDDGMLQRLLDMSGV